MTLRNDASQLKVAEKLIILNDRAVGMLTRIYNIKKACGDPKSKPHFLSDKALDPAIKHIVRKFPVMDTRSNSVYAPVNAMKSEIEKSLSLYYYTFADLIDLKDHIMQLLTTMDACQMHLDITLNYDLTAAYLNLVVSLITLLILLSRVDDRKAVLGLFNVAYELQHGHSEPSFPRLGQMIIDYEVPLKKLAEDLGPLSRLIGNSLVSLSSVYLRRNITADAWRQAQMLSLIASPHQFLFAAQTDTIACEYLSLDTMDRWIILSVAICHSALINQPIILSMWQRALQTGLAIRLFRDELFIVHQQVQQLFDAVKGYHKKSVEVKDHYTVALQTSTVIHADRRRFLRTALRELSLVLTDQPGLLGPKALFVWMALSFARDEVLWLLRHIDIWPSSKKSGKHSLDNISDKQLPELLNGMLELRGLIGRYNEVLRRYYIQYVLNYDAPMCTEMLQEVGNLPEHQSLVLSAFCNSISQLNVNEDQQAVDLRGLRLDWFRMQAAMAVSRSSFPLKENRHFAVAMNTTVFHLKMIDLVDEMLRETSDLSIYCFYSRQLEIHLRQSLELPSQCRYSVSFARICSHFMNSLHDMCPEERLHIIEKSLSLGNMVLDEIAKEAALIVQHLVVYQRTSDELVGNCVVVIADMMRQIARKGAGGVPQPPPLPGDESVRISREQLTVVDRRQTQLVELCSALSAVSQLVIADHVFATREYLYHQLETGFHRWIIETVTDGANPRRPSLVLDALNSYTTVLQNLDTYVSMDMTRLLNAVLLQQTQAQDGNGAETITSIYTKWYLEVVLRRVSSGQILFSPHLREMIASGDQALNFAPDQFTDTVELRALVQLIGPYGVKFMTERLVWHVASQMNELCKIVAEHRELLRTVRTSFDKPDKMRQLLAQLGEGIPKDKRQQLDAMDNVLQRVTIIGEICEFRFLLHAALNDVIEQRSPFLVGAVSGLLGSMSEEDQTLIGEMCASVGVRTKVDIALVNAIRAQTHGSSPDELYHLSCLLMVFIAVSLPRLAQAHATFFKASLAASLNNAHCIPTAVNVMAGALFNLHQRGDTIERMKEFLALASSSLLRMSDNMDRDSMKNPEPVYLLLDKLVSQSPWLSFDLLESCFPYNLLRTSYHFCYKEEQARMDGQ